MIFVLYLSLVGLAACVTVAIRGYSRGQSEDTQLGGILTLFFLVFLVGMEFYARRYVSTIDRDESGIHVETRSLVGKRRRGRVAGIGQEIRQNTAEYDNRHHRLRVEPSGKTYILDVSDDREIAGRIRRELKRRHS